MENFWIIGAKVTIVSAMAIVAAAAARRTRASVRHAIYASLFVALLLLPVAGRLVPKTELPILKSGVPADSPAVVVAPEAVSSAPAGPPALDVDAGRLSLSSIAFAIYGTGVSVMIVALLAGIHRLRRWSKRADLWLDGMNVANEIAATNGIRRAVLVVTCDEVAVPFTFGFLRQTIVMPAAAKSWSDDALRRALRHELEHVRRDDWAMQLVARVACAVYWPHPFVWVAWRRFCVEAERACDDAVIGGADAADYATQLVTLAKRMSQPRAVPVLAMASRSRLSERVTAMLDPARPRGRQSRAAMILTASIMTAVVMTFGSVQLVAAVNSGVEAEADDVEDDVDTYGEAIVKAASDGNIEALDQLFRLTAIDVNTTIDGDGTALLVAARHGQLKAARWLIHRGADPNTPSPGDGNPLIAAASEGHIDVMELLLSRGARVNDVVFGDENALITAADHGELEAVNLLIRHGADVRARVWSGTEWRTALMMARRNDDEDIIRVLMAASATE